jgi:hypothetical protein
VNHKNRRAFLRHFTFIDRHMAPPVTPEALSAFAAKQGRHVTPEQIRTLLSQFHRST